MPDLDLIKQAEQGVWQRVPRCGPAIMAAGQGFVQTATDARAFAADSLRKQQNDYVELNERLYFSRVLGARLPLSVRPLVLDDAAPQSPRLAVRIAHDAAGVVENHRRPLLGRVGGPGRNCRVVRIAVSGEGDPGC